VKLLVTTVVPSDTGCTDPPLIVATEVVAELGVPQVPGTEAVGFVRRVAAALMLML
jgi:hypothetical protein